MWLRLIQTRESMRVLQNDSIRNFSIFSDQIENKPASYFITTIIITFSKCKHLHNQTSQNEFEQNQRVFLIFLPQ